MQPLEEGVLCIGARHAPHGGAGGHTRWLTGMGDRFAEGFHVELLHIRYQIGQPEIVGRQVQ